MDLFGIGFMEILLILILGLIFLGPGKLVEFAQSLGRLSRNLKKMSSDFTTSVTREVNLLEDKNKEKTHLKPTTEKAPVPAPKVESAGKPEDLQNKEPAARP